MGVSEYKWNTQLDYRWVQEQILRCVCPGGVMTMDSKNKQVEVELECRRAEVITINILNVVAWLVTAGVQYRCSNRCCRPVKYTQEKSSQ